MNDTQAYYLKAELLKECTFRKHPTDEEIHPILISPVIGSGLFVAKGIIDPVSEESINRFVKSRGLKMEQAKTKDGFKIFKSI